MPYNYLHKITRILAYFIIAGFLLTGLIETLIEVKPFWLDEWYIIHNLKFKTADVLWGKLDYMQQFPRAYLQVFKKISSSFDYSYTSLRLAPFAIHAAGIVFCLALGRQIFGKAVLPIFVWVMLYIGFRTSLDYFVQVKQYTMEMFMGLVAIWQVISIHRVIRGEQLMTAHWIVLYVSMSIATFFSYTYPILAAPLLGIMMYWLVLRRKELATITKLHILLLVTANLVSMGVFYIADVSQVMQDTRMQNYWKEFVMQDGFDMQLFLSKTYKLFADIGSGALFEIIFAILGIAGWILGIIQVRKHLKSDSTRDILIVYATSVVGLMILLFVAGKLPLGTHRLNAFATPLIALLIVAFLQYLQQKGKLNKPVEIFFFVLFLALAGNVVSSTVNNYTNKDNKEKARIYAHVSAAIKEAQAQQLPIVVDRDIAYPFDQYEEITGDWILETYPAYHVHMKLPVYPADNLEEAQRVLKQHHENAAMYISAKSRQVIANN